MPNRKDPHNDVTAAIRIILARALGRPDASGTDAVVIEIPVNEVIIGRITAVVCDQQARMKQAAAYSRLLLTVYDITHPDYGTHMAHTIACDSIGWYCQQARYTIERLIVKVKRDRMPTFRTHITLNLTRDMWADIRDALCDHLANGVAS